ncbi:MAG: hypothetical protein AAF402_01620 [Pseudomonadota bacterium]
MTVFFDRIIQNLERQIDRFPVTRLIEQHVCLHNVSKTFEVELLQDVPRFQICQGDQCSNVKDNWGFGSAALISYNCDSPLSERLLSTLEGSYVSAGVVFGNEFRRGVQVGRVYFRDLNQHQTGRGIMSGNSNIQSHHQPIYDDPKCDSSAYMDGEFRGVLEDPISNEKCILAVQYSMKYEYSESRHEGTISGILEGSIVCECAPSDHHEDKTKK